MNVHMDRAGAAATAGVFAMAAILATAAPASAEVTNTVKFESVAGPAGFDAAVPLRDEYSSRGIHFRGPSPDDGGAVLDAGLGAWPMPARSGAHILGFDSSAQLSNGGTASWPETIRFDRNQNVVRLFVSQAEPGSEATFTFVAKRAGKVVDTDTVTTDTGDWMRLLVRAPRGISKVVLHATDPDHSWAADDLRIKRR